MIGLAVVDIQWMGSDVELLKLPYIRELVNVVYTCIYKPQESTHHPAAAINTHVDSPSFYSLFQAKKGGTLEDRHTTLRDI